MIRTESTTRPAEPPKAKMKRPARRRRGVGRSTNPPSPRRPLETPPDWRPLRPRRPTRRPPPPDGQPRSARSREPAANVTEAPPPNVKAVTPPNGTSATSPTGKSLRSVSRKSAAGPSPSRRSYSNSGPVMRRFCPAGRTPGRGRTFTGNRRTAQRQAKPALRQVKLAQCPQFGPPGKAGGRRRPRYDSRASSKGRRPGQGLAGHHGPRAGLPFRLLACLGARGNDCRSADRGRPDRVRRLQGQGPEPHDEASLQNVSLWTLDRSSFGGTPARRRPERRRLRRRRPAD